MLPVRICAGGVGTTGVPTATGQHRDDEVTRTEPVGWTGRTQLCSPVAFSDGRCAAILGLRNPLITSNVKMRLMVINPVT